MATTTAYKCAALLIGINYSSVKGATLSGCINDVNDIATFLKTKCGFLPNEITLLDDIKNFSDCTYAGIIRNLYNLALRSWTDKLNFAWIHYSGHGASIADNNGDEVDGKDEALVPVDFQRNGLIRDDIINNLLSMFNPSTRVFFVVDACHSGTIADLKYKYTVPERTCTVESKLTWRNNIKVCLLSGCRDSQTSADAYFRDAAGLMRPAGALTYCLLRTAQADPALCLSNIFELASRTRAALQAGNFGQVPELSSTFDLLQFPTETFVIPPELFARAGLVWPSVTTKTKTRDVFDVSEEEAVETATIAEEESKAQENEVKEQKDDTETKEPEVKIELVSVLKEEAENVVVHNGTSDREAVFTESADRSAFNPIYHKTAVLVNRVCPTFNGTSSCVGRIRRVRTGIYN